MSRHSDTFMTLEEALAEFYEDQEYKGNRPATLRYFRSNLEHFVRDTGVTRLDEFTTSVIRRWVPQFVAVRTE